VTQSSCALDENLARIERRQPALARALRALPACERIARVPGARGVDSLRDGDVLLGSRYEPVREAEAMADEMAAAAPDLQIAIGFGLGLHLAAFRRRRSTPLVVFEPDPARLRAALALAPHPWLDEDRVRLTTDAAELPDLVELFYTSGLCLSTTIHPALLRLDSEAARSAVRWLSRAKDTVDTMVATRVSKLADWTHRTAENTPHFLCTPGLSRLSGAFRGVPAVVVAAGPSLDKQLETLSTHRDRVLVIAIGPSLGALRRAGIEPDLVHVLESSDVAHQLTRSGSTADLNLVLTPKTHAGVYELPVRSRFIAYTGAEPLASWIASELGDRHRISAAGSVALSAVYVAQALGANPVMLIGQDLAFADGRVYASGSCYERIGFEVKGERFQYQNMEERAAVYAGDLARMRRMSEQRLVWVEGWHGDRVPTSVTYATFIQYYRGVAEQLARAGTRLVNCTEGGARIPPLEHCAFADELARCAAAPIDAAARIRAAFEAFAPAAAAQLRAPLRRARSTLVDLQRRTRRARKLAETLAQRAAAMPERELAQRMQELQRAQRAIFDALSDFPWIDSLVQRELQPLITAQHRSDRPDATPAQASAESLAMLRLAEKGLAEARGLERRLEAILLGDRPRRLRRAAAAPPAQPQPGV
jgi:hypothetical protein